MNARRNTATGIARTGQQTTKGNQKEHISMDKNQIAATIAALYPNLPADWAVLNVKMGQKVLKEGSKPGPNAEYEVQSVGTLYVPVPTVKAFGITCETKEPTEDEAKELEGFPFVYADPKFALLQEGLNAQCKMKARNKTLIVDGSIELKEGQKIACTFDELLAEADGAGRGLQMRLQGECAKAVATFMRGLGKSDSIVAFMQSAVSKPDVVLAVQTAQKKQRTLEYLAQFIETLSPEDSQRYARTFAKVNEAAAVAAELDDAF